VRATFKVTREEEGLTVSAVLRRHVTDLPWARAKRLCETGKVKLDGERVTDAAVRVSAGQEVKLDEAAPAPMPDLRVEIVFEDAHVVVIDKPTGVSSVPYEKREGGTAMDLLREAWKRKTGRSASSVPLHVVHRIDKETSGLLAFAKTKLAERKLQELFRAHDVDRTYLCIAHGAVEDRRIESRLVEDRGDGLRGSTRHPKQGKRAVTHVKVIERLPQATLCEVRLETGKTHQIRIHLAEDGHPLVGEKVYIRDFGARGGEPLPSPRLLLHAATLGFVHPITRTKVSLSSPLPPDFTRELERLRRR
jgi:23S rRNA pseudouridine1911/1915/1917 synthase